jgi:uncharacterized protein YfiM (DUF2279 family)
MADKLTPKQFIEKMFGTQLPRDITVDDLRAMLLQQQSGNDAITDALAAPMPDGSRGDATGEDLVPMPQGRGRAFTQGKYEPDADFKARVNREGGPSRVRDKGGLDAMYLMNNRGRTAEEAGTQAEIIRSRGGAVNQTGTKMLKAGVRPAPQSSTGRDYDPVAERKNMLADAGAAVAERKNLQASDLALLQKQEAAARTPGTMRGFANKYGSGQAKTLTPEEFAKRKEATITEGRHRPVTNSMREVLGFMNAEQNAADAAYAEKAKTVGKPMNRKDATFIRGLREQLNGSNVAPNTGMVGMDSLSNLRAGDERFKAFEQAKKNQVSNIGKAFAQRGMA